MAPTQSSQDVAADLIRWYGLTADDFVIEVDSGEGSLLRAIRALGPRVLGIEPDIQVMARAFHGGVDTLAATFHSSTADDIRRRYGPAQLVLSRTVHPAGDDLTQFVATAARLLAPGGAIVILSSGINARVEVRPDPLPSDRPALNHAA